MGKAGSVACDYVKTILNFFQPPADYRNPKIDGSQLRTSSNIHLGGDHRLSAYNTTMDDNFKELSYSARQAIGNNHSSSIPTDYYSK